MPHLTDRNWYALTPIILYGLVQVTVDTTDDGVFVGSKVSGVGAVTLTVRAENGNVVFCVIYVCILGVQCWVFSQNHECIPQEVITNELIPIFIF